MGVSGRDATKFGDLGTPRPAATCAVTIVYGKPHEYIVWFPLMDQFESLLKCKQFEHAVRWEERRKANPNYMCGKYLHAT